MTAMVQRSTVALIVSSVLFAAGGSLGTYGWLQSGKSPATAPETPQTNIGKAPNSTPPTTPEGTASALRERLRKACADERDLHGVRIAAVDLPPGNAFVLQGFVDNESQKGAVLRKANDMLKDLTPSGETPAKVDASKLELVPLLSEHLSSLRKEWAKLQPWEPGADEKRSQTLRQTRLDDAYYTPEDQLVVTAVCVLPLEAEGDVAATIRKEVAAGLGEDKLRRLPLDVRVKRLPNPTVRLQELLAQKPALAGVTLDNAYYSGGTLRVGGVVTRPGPQAPTKSHIEDEIRTQLAEVWRKDGTLRPDDTSEPLFLVEELTAIDTATLPKTLQAQFQASKDKLGRHVRLDSVFFKSDPLHGLQLHFKGVYLRFGSNEKPAVRDHLQKVIQERNDAKKIRVSALDEIVPAAPTWRVRCSFAWRRRRHWMVSLSPTSLSTPMGGFTFTCSASPTRRNASTTFSRRN